MDFFEKLLWIFSLLGLLCLAVAVKFIGQRSRVRDDDIKVNVEKNLQKQEKAFLSVLKYVNAKERKKILRQMAIRKKMAKTRPVRNTKARSSMMGAKRYIREADTNALGYLPPNTQVKMVSEDFKLKYANSFQEVMSIAKQAGSRFVRTPSGPRPQIVWINPGTIIHKLGFRPGDVVMRVNGHPVSSIRDGKTLYDSLRQNREFLIEVLRQGKLFRFVYKVGD